MKKFIVFMLALALLAGGSAWAFDQNDHVVVAPNGKGDYIIFPLWAAAQGYETTFQITNTSDVNSVVVKLFFNSPKFTQEVRDFFIFLSPNDVFKAVIRRTASGVILISTDDSVLTADCTFASPTNPFVTTLPAPRCETDADMSAGYFSAQMVAFYPYGKNATGAFAGTVPKMTIRRGFGDLRNSDVFPDAAGTGMNRTIATSLVCGGTGTVPPMYVGTLNVLSAYMNIGVSRETNLATQTDTPSTPSASIKPTILRNFDTSLTAKDTLEQVSTFDKPEHHNSVEEVEAALSKNNLWMPYAGRTSTYHIFTFPTKQTLLRTPSQTNPCGVDSWVSRFFRTYNSTNLRYVSSGYDLSEMTEAGGAGPIVSPVTGADPDTMAFEVQYLTGFPFDEGWERYTFFAPGQSTAGVGGTGTTGEVQRNRVNPGDPDVQIRFYGVPVIGTVLDLTHGENMFGASYDDTDVQLRVANGPWRTYYYYQYWDSVHYPSSEDNFGYRRLDADPATAGYQRLIPDQPWPVIPAGSLDGNLPESE